jgi:hypothetical protein
MVLAIDGALVPNNSGAPVTDIQSQLCDDLGQLSALSELDTPAAAAEPVRTS